MVTNLADTENLQTRVHYTFRPRLTIIFKQPQIQQFLYPSCKLSLTEQFAALAHIQSASLLVSSREIPNNTHRPLPMELTSLPSTIIITYIVDEVYPVIIPSTLAADTL